MVIGDLLPIVLAAGSPRRVTPAGNSQDEEPRRQAALPHERVAIESATRAVLEEFAPLARRRFVELQLAVEPGLVAQASLADYRTCLGCLVLAAVGRAASGVLVTATQQIDGVEVAVLDDGTLPAGGQAAGAPAAGAQAANEQADYAAGPAWAPASAPGATVSVVYQPELGTTALLRLRRADWRPAPSNEAAAAVLAGSSATI
jgi:hypothetical protein